MAAQFQDPSWNGYPPIWGPFLKTIVLFGYNQNVAWLCHMPLLV